MISLNVHRLALTLIWTTFLTHLFRTANSNVALNSCHWEKVLDRMIYCLSFSSTLEINLWRCYLELFNLTWTTGIPCGWRKGEILPILKANKDPGVLNSYRQISLSVMCKLTERLIANRLNHYLEKFCCLPGRQAGFRKYWNTTKQIARLIQEIKDAFH